jgi:fluoride ion exporter CrcB/FEX
MMHLWVMIAPLCILGASTRFFTNYVFANLLGCIVIGFVGSGKDSKRSWINPDLARAIAVGYCGALTSFSAWIYEIAGDLLQRKWESAIFSVGFIHFAVCVVGIYIGMHLQWGFGLIAFGKENQARFVSIAKILDVLMILICALSLLIPIGLEWEKAAQISNLLVFVCAPAGTFLRWYLSKLFNPSFESNLFKSNYLFERFPWFPYGTLLANNLGCIVNSSISHFSSENLYAKATSAFFAGSLSTMSSFIKELTLSIDCAQEDRDTKELPSHISPSNDSTMSNLLAKYSYGAITILSCLMISLAIQAI